MSWGEFLPKNIHPPPSLQQVTYRIVAPSLSKDWIASAWPAGSKKYIQHCYQQRENEECLLNAHNVPAGAIQWTSPETSGRTSHKWAMDYEALGYKDTSPMTIALSSKTLSKRKITTYVDAVTQNGSISARYQWWQGRKHKCASSSEFLQHTLLVQTMHSILLR